MSVRVVVSNPETGDSYQVESDVNEFTAREIGDEVDGSAVGLDGYTLEITGGSDETGRPMRGDVEGQGIAEIMVTGGTGFNPTRATANADESRSAAARSARQPSSSTPVSPRLATRISMPYSAETRATKKS